LFLMVWVLSVPVGKLQVGSHVLFTEEWLLSGHTTIKAWLVKCWRDGCPSGRFSHLHRDSGALRVTIGFLVTSLTKALHPWLLSLAGWPAFGRVLVEATADIFLAPYPRSVPGHNPVSVLYGQFRLPHGLVFALTCTVNGGTLYRQVCALPQVDYNQIVEISRMIIGNRMHLSSI
jgi:hypothetical protein